MRCNTPWLPDGWSRLPPFGLVSGLLTVGAAMAQGVALEPEIVRFASGDQTLGGELYMPAGPGPFPAVLYNHGSAPGMLSSQASRAIGPRFARSGWLFFMPYRRGQGLSADAGPYIGDALAAARHQGGLKQASETLGQLLATTQLDDQLAALAWLRSRGDVLPSRIAAAGNSLGGVQALLGGAAASYCAVVASSAGSQSWADSPDLRQLLLRAAREARAPVLLFQAQNDHDLAPNQALRAELQRAGKAVEQRVYPAFGSSAQQGHAFAYQGSDIWFADVLDFLQLYCP